MPTLSRVNPPVRLAILGGGAVTEEYYVRAEAMCDEVEIVLIVEPSKPAEARLRAAGYTGKVEQTGWEAFLKEASEIEKHNLDAFVIALPNALHEAAVLRTLELGYPILCEKPLALTEGACLRIAEAELRSGQPVMVGMVRRKLASVSALREALAANLIGEVREVKVEHGDVYQWMSDSGAFFHPSSGGVLADMGVHYLDLVSTLFGELSPLKYDDDWAGGCEANAYFQLRTGRGVPVSLRLSRDRSLTNRFSIIGENGRLILEKDNFSVCFWEPTQRPGFRAELTATAPFSNPKWPATFHSAFAEQVTELAQLIRGKREGFPTVKEAARTTALIEWAYSTRATRKSAPSETSRPVLETCATLVTGGSGFIGQHLIERLSELKCSPLRVPVRNFRTCVESARFPVELLRLDLLDAERVHSAIRGVKHVFHLAYGRDGAEARAITVQGTKNVVEAAIAAKAESVIVLSTMFVFGYPMTGADIDETAPYRPTGGDYGKTKMEMEQWCLERAKQSPHTRIVILNPSFVYGPGGKTFTRMPVELAREGRFCWVEGGNGFSNYSYVGNVIDAMILAATHPAAHGQRFLINDGTCTWKEFFGPMLGHYAANLPSYSLAQLESFGPKRAGLRDVLRALAGNRELIEVVDRLPVLGPLKLWLLARFPGLRKLKAPKEAVFESGLKSQEPPPSWLGELFGPARPTFSGAKAKKVLGWVPRVDLIEGQRRSIEWLAERNLIESKALDGAALEASNRR